jgi:hypothetical protein
MAYQALAPQIRSEKDVYVLISKKIGKTPVEVEASWKDESTRGSLIEAFQRAFLLEVERSNTTVAGKIDAAGDIQNYQTEKAKEQAGRSGRSARSSPRKAWSAKSRPSLPEPGSRNSTPAA